MKKTLAVLLTAALLALSLASCGGFSYDDVSLVEDGYVTLGDYKNIDKSKLSFEANEASDDEVYAHAVEHLDHSEVGTVTDRAAEEFDVVNIGFVGTIDGVEFEGGASDSTDLVIGAGNFIPGFEDGIIGMSVGETKDVPVTFPENYGKEELNGKAAVFAITLNTIYDPAILEDVRAELSEGDTEATIREDLWALIEEQVTVNTYPESYVKELAKNQYKYYEYMYRSMGMMQDMEDLGVTMEGCTEDAKNQIDYEFAVYAISEAEGITATEEELSAKVDEYVQMYIGYGYSEADAKAMFSNESVEIEVLQKKIVDAVLDHIGGIELPEM